MTLDFFAFSVHIDPILITGTSLWALTLYLGWASLRQRIMDGLMQWFNFAERSLYVSQEEFENTRAARESQNAFWASILGIVPFLVLGGLSDYSLRWGLGPSWSISFGLMGVILCGIYELARNSKAL